MNEFVVINMCGVPRIYGENFFCDENENNSSILNINISEEINLSINTRQTVMYFWQILYAVDDEQIIGQKY